MRPEPPIAWEGTFLAVYPDGGRSDFDLGGYTLRPGDQVPGKSVVLDRWNVTDTPIARGEFGVVGILREAEADERLGHDSAT